MLFTLSSSLDEFRLISDLCNMKHWDTRIGTDIQEAAHWLQQGELVAIPTETVYGLAANALDVKAVRKIFAAKNRPFFNPLIVHVAGISQVEQYVSDFPPLARRLAEAFWPGPLTLVLPRKELIPDLVTASHPTVAIRVPGHLMTVSLLKILDFPVAAPSANPFGYISPTTASHVKEQLDGALPYILDGGPCEVGVESTILSFEGDRVRILRYGGVSVEDIEAIAGEVIHPDSESLKGQVIAPGMLKSHYAPKKRLCFGDVNRMIRSGRFDLERTGVLSFSRKVEHIPDDHQIVLSLSGDLDQAAQRLFDALHVLDQMDLDVILAEEFPQKAIGMAINDRLRRASRDPD